MCAVNCRKLKFTVSGSAIMLPDASSFSFYATFPSSRAQNRDFCALFSETVGFAGRGNLISASAGRVNLLAAPAELVNLVAASAGRGNLFSTPAWSCNLIAARTASGFAELSCRLSSHRGKWRRVTAPPA